MALQKSFNLENIWINLPEAYIRIHDFILNKTWLSITVCIYVNQEQRGLGKSSIYSKIYIITDFTWISDTILWQMFKWTEEQKLSLCYAWLKMLTDFDWAIDV